MILWILFGCLIISAYLCKRFGVVHFLISIYIIHKKSASITASRLHFSLIYSNYVLSDLLSNNQLKRILKT